MSAQIERLTDALVRASQKSNIKEKLLMETSAKLRAVQVLSLTRARDAVFYVCVCVCVCVCPGGA